MKDRVTTLGLAVVALVLFYVLVMQPSAPAVPITRPITTERGPNGYYALFQWLNSQRIPAVSMRERFDALAVQNRRSRTGNLLITTMPHAYAVRPTELPELRQWIEAGNTLLVLAALTDTPDWSFERGEDRQLIEHLQELTGLQFEGSMPLVAEAPVQTGKQESSHSARSLPKMPSGGQGGAAPAPKAAEEKPAQHPEGDKSLREQARDQAAAAADSLQEALGSEERELLPNGPHPFFKGVRSVRAISEFPGTDWSASGEDGSLVLALAHNPSSDYPVMWLARLGEGHVIVSAYGSLFVNKVLGQQDNARLLANIVALTRSAQGAVIVDDAHQGVASFYDAKAFYRDSRLHHSLWWLLGLWLVFVLGALPLRAQHSRWQPVDITGFVRATGGFMARVLRPAAAAQRLFVNFFNHVRGHVGLPQNGAPVWDWLETQSAVPATDIEQLTAMHKTALRGGNVDLVKVQNLLVATQKNLL